MAAREIIPGFYEVQGKYVDYFGYVRSYLVVDDDEVLVIDPGTAGSPGRKILDALKKLGLQPKKSVVGILCTHGHPDHVGGVSKLKRATNSPVMIHERDAELLEDPSRFINERLLLDFAGRFAMKMEKGPLRVNFKGVIPDKLVQDGDEIKVGSLSVKAIHTGGHSAGHCTFYEPFNKVLFSGDELNNFPNDPRRFYVDLSGSLPAKLNAIDRMESLEIEYLLPSHDTPYFFDDAKLQFSEVRDAVRQFQNHALENLKARGEVDIGQLVYDFRRLSSVPIPEVLEALLPTTILVALESLKKAGLVRVDQSGIWSSM